MTFVRFLRRSGAEMGHSTLTCHRRAKVRFSIFRLLSLSLLLPELSHFIERLNSVSDLGNLARVEFEQRITELQHPGLARILRLDDDSVRVGDLDLSPSQGSKRQAFPIQELDGNELDFGDDDPQPLNVVGNVQDYEIVLVILVEPGQSFN